MPPTDPRAFATYKIWLSKQDDREPAKKKRDATQAMAVKTLVNFRRVIGTPLPEKVQVVTEGPVGMIYLDQLPEGHVTCDAP